MAILEKEIMVKIVGSNINYYEEKGYKLPKRKRNKYANYTVPYGTEILVKIEHLQKRVKSLVTKICDICDKNCGKVQYCTITAMREKSTDKKDRCRECGIAHRDQKRIQSNSLKDFAIDNKLDYLIEEYSDKNPLGIDKIFKGTARKVLWKCIDCSEEFKMSPNYRTSSGLNAKNCPFCHGRKISDKNNLWNTSPETAKLLKVSEDGYKFTKGSNELGVFSCPSCGEDTVKKIVSVANNPNSCLCESCSDSRSFPEKIMQGVLVNLDISFEKEKTFDWSKSNNNGLLRYDFYLPKFNCIIEVHGAQHYGNKSFQYLGGRTSSEEILNDAHKYEQAKNNGIKKYIVIDCSKSDFNFIKENILKSELKNMLDIKSVDWTECLKFSSNSTVRMVSTLRNQGLESKEIAREMGIHQTTAIRYMKRGNELGWCSYDPKHSGRPKKQSGNKQIVKLDKNNNFIEDYKNIEYVKQDISNINKYYVIYCCEGKIRSHAGFKWMYYEDYKLHKINK